MIGSFSESLFSTTGSCAASGSSSRMRPTAARTSLAATSMSRPASNSITVRLDPRSLSVEMERTPAMPAMVSSMGLATSASITSGAAPSYVTLTVTSALSTSGSSRTGSCVSAATPAMTRRRFATIARTGRLRESSESVMRVPPSASASPSPDRRRRPAGGRRRSRPARATPLPGSQRHRRAAVRR